MECEIEEYIDDDRNVEEKSTLQEALEMIGKENEEGKRK